MTSTFRNFCLATIVLIASSCSTRKTTEQTTGDVPAVSSTTGQPPASKPSPDTTAPVGPPVKNPGTTTTTEPVSASLPGCISKMIETFRSEEVKNPPRKIFRYTYQGKTVYYVPALCCDFYSDLYDAQCNLLGHPDGGYTGKGDGKFPDFEKKRTDEKLIWADERKR
jgi:hypothetical protein